MRPSGISAMTICDSHNASPNSTTATSGLISIAQNIAIPGV